MALLVPDTSALVSLGVVADAESDPLSITFERYEVLTPRVVVNELAEVASYADVHANAADAALDYAESGEIADTPLDETFPLDDGENAAVSLANKHDADLLLCDEFNQLSLVHASLSETRLVTTPTLLLAYMRRNWLSRANTRTHLDELADVRSWEENAYVKRVRERLES